MALWDLQIETPASQNSHSPLHQIHKNLVAKRVRLPAPIKRADADAASQQRDDAGGRRRRRQTRKVVANNGELDASSQMLSGDAEQLGRVRADDDGWTTAAAAATLPSRNGGVGGGTGISMSSSIAGASSPTATTTTTIVHGGVHLLAASVAGA